jgi:HAD superfamily hydrolase (TIGR01509 family)
MTAAAYDLVIFDCDGVLVDNEHLASKADRAVLAQHGIVLPRTVVALRYAGLSYPDMIASVNGEFGTAISADAFEEQANAKLDHAFANELRAIPGISRLIGDITVSKCVASSSSPDKLQKTLRLTDLDKLFEPHIFSTALVSRGKPAPDIIHYACDKVQADPKRSIVIEDSAHGIRAARTAGAEAIGFVGGSHCGPETIQALRDAGARMIARDAAELRALLSI